MDQKTAVFGFKRSTKSKLSGSESKTGCSSSLVSENSLGIRFAEKSTSDEGEKRNTQTDTERRGGERDGKGQLGVWKARACCYVAMFKNRDQFERSGSSHRRMSSPENRRPIYVKTEREACAHLAPHATLICFSVCNLLFDRPPNHRLAPPLVGHTQKNHLEFFKLILNCFNLSK
jgi:hypothetical protein